MKRIFLGLTALLLFFPYLNTQAADPNLSYYQIRYQIACRDYDTTDARCFWNKVEFVHAKELLGRGDISDYLTDDELERIEKKIGFLETRYDKFCMEADEASYFCPALNKLVEKGQYFLENEQAYAQEEGLHESASTTYECNSDIYNCSDFSTHSEAQSAHDYCMSEVGFDIHGLDQDDDGVACELLQ